MFLFSIIEQGDIFHLKIIMDIFLESINPKKDQEGFYLRDVPYGIWYATRSCNISKAQAL